MFVEVPHSRVFIRDEEPGYPGAAVGGHTAHKRVRELVLTNTNGHSNVALGNPLA